MVIEITKGFSNVGFREKTFLEFIGILILIIYDVDIP